MGQAKKRGTYQQRKNAALDKERDDFLTRQKLLAARPAPRLSKTNTPLLAYLAVAAAVSLKRP